MTRLDLINSRKSGNIEVASHILAFTKKKGLFEINKLKTFRVFTSKLYVHAFVKNSSLLSRECMSHDMTIPASLVPDYCLVDFLVATLAYGFILKGAPHRKSMAC